jgi:hypoxanthine phosphoribosyltransferase
MQHKATSSVVPDFYADVIKDWRWIIYPWAAHEDLVGFTEKVLSVELTTREQIRARLKEQYTLVLDENCLTEVLDDLIEMKKAEKIQAKYRKI